MQFTTEKWSDLKSEVGFFDNEQFLEERVRFSENEAWCKFEGESYFFDKAIIEFDNW